MPMPSTLNVALGRHSYDIHIQNNIIKNAGAFLRAQGFTCPKIFIASDDNVFARYGDALLSSLSDANYKLSHIILPHGEDTKSLTMLGRLYEAMAEAHITRGDCVLALGGGVIGDLAGFAAATFLRGVPYIQVPTSLLSQVDSSVGGKVAIDLPQGKNMAGSFYQPACVLIDPLVLNTLSPRVFCDGMGEVIKYACIQDGALFDLLINIKTKDELSERLQEIITKCLNIKIKIVEQDEFDRGDRMLLNFGHTIGHAIEKAQNYNGFSHGEAVAMGMHIITKLSETIGFTERGTAERIKQCLIKYNLPYELPPDQRLNKKALIDAIATDKKNIGDTLNIILLKHIGKACIYKTTPDFFYQNL